MVKDKKTKRILIIVLVVIALILYIPNILARIQFKKDAKMLSAKAYSDLKAGEEVKPLTVQELIQKSYMELKSPIDQKAVSDEELARKAYDDLKSPQAAK